MELEEAQPYTILDAVYDAIKSDIAQKYGEEEAQTYNAEAFEGEFLYGLRSAQTLLFKILPIVDNGKTPFLATLDENFSQAYRDLSRITDLIDSSDKPEWLLSELAPEFTTQLIIDDNYETDNHRSWYNLALKAVEFFMEHCTVEQIQALNEEDQLCLVELFDVIFPPENSNWHQKLVFGLHIPKEALDYHERCIQELQTRIIASPVFAEHAALFLSEMSPAPYMEEETDRRFASSFIMKQLEAIWQTPELVEEDYADKGNEDKSGKVFVSAMHALGRYKPSNEDKGDMLLNVEKLGYIWGVNTTKGYLPDASEFDLRSLAHEFGHLFSTFLSHGRNKTTNSNPFFSREPTATKNLKVFSKFSTQNKGINSYYDPVKHNFQGFNAPKTSQHPYKGQIEERHADWLGNAVLKGIRQALRLRVRIWNIEAIRGYTTQNVRGIFSILEINKTEPQKAKDLLDALSNAKTRWDIYKTVAGISDYIDEYLSENPTISEKSVIVLPTFENDADLGKSTSDFETSVLETAKKSINELLEELEDYAFFHEEVQIGTTGSDLTAEDFGYA